MTRLLVSVRDATEAEIACRPGVSVIDVKEPDRGALGAADPNQWQAVVQQIAGRRPVSVALGELLDDRPTDWWKEFPPIAFAKIGLAGCADCPDWPLRWNRQLARIPSSIQRVAVCYADYRLARAPSFDQVLPLAKELGCRAVLWDTWNKEAGNLFDWTTESQLSDSIRRVHECRMFAAVAGSLDCRHAAPLIRADADWMAVRGAVCHGSRRTSVCGSRIDLLAAQLRKTRRSGAGWRQKIAP